jgi:hypothetical protein
MKYFTRDIWAGWQSNRKGVFERAMKKWNTNRTRYRASIRKVSARLGGRQGKFFTDHSMHDGRLLLFEVKDWPRSNLKSKRMSCATSVQMAILTGRKNAEIYTLHYRGVQEVSMQTKNDLFPLDDSRFGDWGYDELLADNTDVFRHNILFQTGTEISIVFRKFIFRRHKASTEMLERYAG